MYANIMRLTKDVEVRTVQSNDKERTVCNGRVAIETGGAQSTFINITAWNSIAEVMAKYLKKGDEFYAEGEIKNDTMQVYTKEGEKKEIQGVYLLIDKMKFTHGNSKKHDAPMDDNQAEPPETAEAAEK